MRLTLFSLVTILMALSAAAQNTDLRELTLREQRLGWESVGRVDIEGHGFCTGTLIATDLVLTAAHCVVDMATGEPFDPGRLTFKAGYTDGRVIAKSDAVRTVAHPRYDWRDSLSETGIRHDVALVQLANPIPAAVAAPFPVAMIAPQVRDVSVVSYARGRQEALSWQMRCGVVGRSDGLIAFDCDVDFGASGSPVFDRSGQRARIVSIIAAGNRREDGVISVGMELPEVVADLKNALRSAPASRGSEPRRLTPGGDQRDSGARFLRP